ncbi:hypothetical protein D3C81_2179800 [compost metagenome]
MAIELPAQPRIEDGVGQPHLQHHLVIMWRMEHRQVRGIQPLLAAKQHHAVQAPGQGRGVGEAGGEQEQRKKEGAQHGFHR